MLDYAASANDQASRMKRHHFVVRPAALILLGLSILLAGCGSGETSNHPDKVNVVTTFYPLYYLAEVIGGEHAHVVNLVPAGVEPHDWTPKSRDLTIVYGAQLFLYHGAGLEGWTKQFLQGLPADSPLVRVEASRGIALIDQSGEIVHEEHDHEDGEHEHESHGQSDHVHAGTDPHTWVSPKSAKVLAANILDAFVQVDQANQSAYEARYSALIDKLDQLDQAYESQLAPHRGKDIVVSHQAFAYLCRDYGLNQVAIMGVSPDAEPRSQDMLKIIRYIKEQQIKYIFLEQLVSSGPAQIIASETGAQLLVLNPLEGLTPQQAKSGEDYVSLMESNLQNLLQALQ